MSVLLQSNVLNALDAPAESRGDARVHAATDELTRMVERKVEPVERVGR